MNSDRTPLLFLFDIDGTLLRGGTQVHRDSFAHAYRKVFHLDLSLDGIPPAGRTDTWLFAEPLRRCGVPDTEIWQGMPEAFEAMADYVCEHIQTLHERVLPGVREVLASLDKQGHLLGLLTGNLSSIAMTKLDAAGLGHYFDTGGFGEESETRSHLVPVALRNASQRVGRRFSAQRVLVIGDTPLDVEAGKAHGTRTCAVATGPYSVDQLRGTEADVLLPSFDDPGASVQAMVSVLLPQ